MNPRESDQSRNSNFAAALPIVAIIGGSGFYALNHFDVQETISVKTPYGVVDNLQIGRLEGRKVVFMMRHGAGHKAPPHKINYRANIWALQSIGVKQIIAVNAVGGIGDDCGPGSLVVPDQIIDYTYGREHTFVDVLSDELNHIEFSEPYTHSLRLALLKSAASLSLSVIESGCYACTQGPRLETSAEIKRLKADGNTLVGMTAMPEAALACELNIEYASICIVANWGAGLTQIPITLEYIHQTLKGAVSRVHPWLQQFLKMSI